MNEPLNDWPADHLEAAWGIIANAGGGDWTTQTPEWREAAERWRDELFARRPSPGQAEAWAAYHHDRVDPDA